MANKCPNRNNSRNKIAGKERTFLFEEFSDIESVDSDDESVNSIDEIQVPEVDEVMMREKIPEEIENVIIIGSIRRVICIIHVFKCTFYPVMKKRYLCSQCNAEICCVCITKYFGIEHKEEDNRKSNSDSLVIKNLQLEVENLKLKSRNIRGQNPR